MESMPDVFREKKPVASISIAPLQGINSESALDWQGRTVEQGLSAVHELTGVTIGLDGDLVLGRQFWRAFLRGGYQAGAWVIDTARTGTA
jgi:hypothetical protein